MHCCRSSPGYAVTLVAESDSGCVLSAEYCAKPQQLPEEVGKQAVHLLLQEILQVTWPDALNAAQDFVIDYPCLHSGRLCRFEQPIPDGALHGALP